MTQGPVACSSKRSGVLIGPGQAIYRRLDVIRSVQLTPNMRRIVLGGAEAAGFNFYGASFGPYIKLVIPVREGVELPPGGASIDDPVAHRTPDYAFRTYTVRNFNVSTQELTVDFVLHGDEGIAARWAARAAPGDNVGLVECGFMRPFGFDWYLFAGDHTALPAIAQSLAALPQDSFGHALISVPHLADRQELSAPKGVQVTWLLEDRRRNISPLIDAVRILAPPVGARIFIWAGAEAQTARALRSYAKRGLGLASDQHFILNYWRRGKREGV